MIPPLLAFLAGMAAYLGLLHLLTVEGAEHRGRHVSMAFLAFLLSAYILFSMALYQVADPVQYAILARGQGAVAILVAAAAFWFVAYYTGVRPLPFLVAVTVVLLTLLVVNLRSPAGIFFGHIARLDHATLPWGEVVPVPVATSNPLETWFDLAFWPLPLYVLYAMMSQYRRGERRDAVLMGVAMAVVLVPTFVDTFVLGVSIFPFPFTEVSFIVLLSVMSVGFRDGIVTLARTRRALEQSERLAEVLVESAPDGIAIIDGTSGEVVRLNAEGRHMLRIPERRPPGDVRAFLADTGRGAITPERLVEVAESSLHGSPQVLETTLRRSDGTDFPVEVRCTALPADPDRKLLRVSFVDISERVDAEEREGLLTQQLHQAQKLETLGTLAGGIAHDFNNLLTPILGCAELSLVTAEEGSELQDNLALIMESAERSRDLVQQILAFSRRGVPHHGTVYIESAIKQALRLLEASRPANIEVAATLRASEARVGLDQTQIQQILMNLATNAMQAMPRGGRLGVRLECVSPDDEHEGGEAILEVTDTGTGIEAEVLDRIFDPFFTTKAVNEGTGLGLSVVYGIATGAGGRVDVESEQGQGTSFRIHLPLIKDEGPTVAAVGPGAGGAVCRVLVIDDNVATLESLRRMVAGIGHEAEVCADPDTAVSTFRNHPDGYDVVIVDYDMPSVNGGDLARELRAVNDSVRIVCASGSEVPAEARATIDVLLPKPPRLHELEEAIAPPKSAP